MRNVLKRHTTPLPTRTCPFIGKRQLKDQLSLVNIDDLLPLTERAVVQPSRGERRWKGGRKEANGTGNIANDGYTAESDAIALGKAVNGKFCRRDFLLSGTLSARELGLALEDVGVTLQPAEASCDRSGFQYR